ncbi:MAG: DUF58 domain-containing protein, partial [Rhodospirillales bacterium]|nr:DUF58 domain-containing protein [Rhodospirillales bacterium]
GRTDKLYLKQYQQETNLDLILLVDTSGSMAYASHGRAQAAEQTGAKTKGDTKTNGAVWRKYDCAASLAAAMAYLALRQQDRVGVWLFNKRVVASSRLSNSQGHWRTITELLSQAELTDAQRPNILTDDEEEARTTNFERIFNRIFSQVGQRSLFVLISDLFDDPQALEKGLARLHHRHHDVILLRTMDPAELTFPFRSPTEFIGLEAEGKLPVDPASLRKAYLDVLGEHLRAVEQVARKFRFDYLLVDTQQPVGPPLSHFLARRAASIAKD